VSIIGIHHVNLLVDDLDAARRFYGEVFGFTELARPDFGFPGAWYQMGAQQLHLQTTPGPEKKSAQHFALQVDDCSAMADSLEAKGVEIFRLDAVDGAGRQAFCNDPAGNLIELNEPVAAPAHTA
jgi:catechol 2,3-dioxygenase-like lactoylglutathione lyase family enzyme